MARKGQITKHEFGMPRRGPTTTISHCIHCGLVKYRAHTAGGFTSYTKNGKSVYPIPKCVTRQKQADQEDSIK